MHEQALAGGGDLSGWSARAMPRVAWSSILSVLCAHCLTCRVRIWASTLAIWVAENLRRWQVHEAWEGVDCCAGGWGKLSWQLSFGSRGSLPLNLQLKVWRVVLLHGHHHGAHGERRIMASSQSYWVRILILTRFSGVSQAHGSLGNAGLHACSFSGTPLHDPWVIFWGETGALTTPSTHVPLPSPLSCLKSPMAPWCLQDQVQASWPGTTGISAVGSELTFSTRPHLHSPQPPGH